MAAIWQKFKSLVSIIEDTDDDCSVCDGESCRLHPSEPVVQNEEKVCSPVCLAAAGEMPTLPHAQKKSANEVQQSASHSSVTQSQPAENSSYFHTEEFLKYKRRLAGMNPTPQQPDLDTLICIVQKQKEELAEFKQQGNASSTRSEPILPVQRTIDTETQYNDLQASAKEKINKKSPSQENSGQREEETHSPLQGGEEIETLKSEVRIIEADRKSSYGVTPLVRKRSCFNISNQSSITELPSDRSMTVSEKANMAEVFYKFQLVENYIQHGMEIHPDISQMSPDDLLDPPPHYQSPRTEISLQQHQSCHLMLSKSQTNLQAKPFHHKLCRKSASEGSLHSDDGGSTASFVSALNELTLRPFEILRQTPKKMDIPKQIKQHTSHLPKPEAVKMSLKARNKVQSRAAGPLKAQTGLSAMANHKKRQSASHGYTSQQEKEAAAQTKRMKERVRQLSRRMPPLCEKIDPRYK